MRFLLSSLLLLFCASTSASAFGVDSVRHQHVTGILPVKGETLIAICDVSHDWTADTSNARLIAIARYVNGRFEEIVDSNASDDSPTYTVEASNITRFFRAHHDLTLYASGRHLAATVGEIYYEEGCDVMLVASARGNWSSKALMPMHRTRGSADDTTVTYSYLPFVALSGPASAHTSRPENFAPPTLSEARSLRAIANHLHSSAGSSNPIH